MGAIADLGSPTGFVSLWEGRLDDGRLLEGLGSAQAAVAAHRRLRSGPLGRALGSFVVPGLLLAEVAAAIVRSSGSGTAPWSLGVVTDVAAVADAAALHAELGPGVRVRFVEVAWEHVDDAGALAASLDEPALVLRVPPERLDDPEETVASLARVRPRVGAAMAIGRDRPSSTTARFLVAATRHGLPVRVIPAPARAFTTPGEGVGVVNLLVAGALAAAGEHPEVVMRALDDDAGSYRLGLGAVGWRDRRIEARRLRETGVPTTLTVTDPEEVISTLGSSGADAAGARARRVEEGASD